MTSVHDWEYDKTVSAPAKIKIEYTVSLPDGTIEKRTSTLTSTQWTETKTIYKQISYYDKDKNIQVQDVVDKRESKTRNTIAAVNASYVKWRLERGLGLPSGEANKLSTTDYSYRVTTEGPKVFREMVSEFITEAELAGSLAITDYSLDGPFEENGGYLRPKTTPTIMASATLTEYTELTDKLTGRTHTKTKVTRFMAQGLTQEGQQSAAEQLKQLDGTDDRLQKIITAMAERTCDGTEVRTSIGRAPVYGRPDDQTRAMEEILNPELVSPETVGSGAVYSTYYNTGGSSGSTLPTGGWTEEDLEAIVPTPTGSGGSTSGSVSFDNSDNPSFEVNTVRSYSLPYAPDDYLNASDQLVAGGVEEAARNYGAMMNRLAAGNAYGCNISTSIDRLPGQAFAPIYLNAGGISAGMRLNGTSWAFDRNGLVCSSDLLLCGVAGRTEPVTSSWVKVPIPATSLPLLAP
jgi:hypothetical protein